MMAQESQLKPLEVTDQDRVKAEQVIQSLT